MQRDGADQAEGQLPVACQTGCVTCCQQKGFVYLTEDDIVRAAAFLGMSAAEFERKFVYRTTNLRRLRTPRGP